MLFWYNVHDGFIPIEEDRRKGMERTKRFSVILAAFPDPLAGYFREQKTVNFGLTGESAHGAGCEQPFGAHVSELFLQFDQKAGSGEPEIFMVSGLFG